MKRRSAIRQTLVVSIGMMIVSPLAFANGYPEPSFTIAMGGATMSQKDVVIVGVVLMLLEIASTSRSNKDPYSKHLYLREIRIASEATLRDPEITRDSAYSDLVEAFRFDQSMTYIDRARLVARFMLDTQGEVEQFHGESYPVTEVIRDVLGDHYNDRNAQILNNLAELNAST